MQKKIIQTITTNIGNEIEFIDSSTNWRRTKKKKMMSVHIYTLCFYLSIYLIVSTLEPKNLELWILMPLVNIIMKMKKYAHLRIAIHISPSSWYKWVGKFCCTSFTSVLSQKANLIEYFCRTYCINWKFIA